MSLPTAQLSEVQQFLYHEARLLDRRLWEPWLDLFTDDGVYWIPLDYEDEAPGGSLSILFEDKAKLELRCRRYAHPLVHSQTPPSRTSHLISNVALADSYQQDHDSLVVEATFMVREFRPGGRVDWVGQLEYQLVRAASTFKIQRKKVLLVDCEGELETIHVPL